MATTKTFEFFSFVLKLHIVSSIFTPILHNLFLSGDCGVVLRELPRLHSFWQFFFIRAFTDITCKYSNYAQNLLYASIVGVLISLFPYQILLFHKRL